MFNFENEILLVKDRYLRYYLGGDFFHDGFIHNIKILENYVQMTISSYREWESMSDSIDYDKYGDKYRYICKFKGCKFYEAQISDNGYIFLNGRFKDSAKAREINMKYPHNHLHLRIQTTGGYIDLIFNKFEIEKLHGEVVMPKKVEQILNYRGICNYLKDIDLDTVLDMAENGNEFEKARAIQYLGAIDHKDAYELALQTISEDEVKIPAIWVLGNKGNKETLPILFNEWIIAEGLLKKHIQDAIDKINFRMKLDFDDKMSEGIKYK